MIRPSRIVRAVTRDGSARIFAADTTDIVREAIEIHHLSKTAAAALGRCLTGTSLMGTLLKDPGDTLTVQFRGDGPLGTVLCVSDYSGNVRGYAEHPEVELPPNAQGKLDVGSAIGHGSLYVIRDSGMKEPYIGTAPIVSGEIAEDLTNYYALSEQIPTVCALGVRVHPDKTVKSAGGFLLQLLPGYEEKIVDLIEKQTKMLPSVSALIADGETPESIIARVFGEIPYDIFDEIPVSYRCNCSRERYARGLAGLPVEDLTEMATSGEEVRAVCQFCGKEYVFTPEEIRQMLENRNNIGKS